jgi:hypothetical protein
MSDDITTPDHAERVRDLFEVYGFAYTQQIRDMITDLLHLADVDEYAGGGAQAAREAVSRYVAERPVWPTAPVYLGQYRPAGQGWITLVHGVESVDRLHVAGSLCVLVRGDGLRFSELQLRIQDLVVGEVVTADDGTAFRVVRSDQA